MSDADAILAASDAPGSEAKGDTMTEETASSTYRQANEKASKALLDVITDTVADIRSNNFTLAGQSSKVRDLAYAYRLVVGGPQPGSIEVSSK